MNFFFFFFHSLFYVYLNSLSISVSLTLHSTRLMHCAWFCIFAPLKLIFSVHSFLLFFFVYMAFLFIYIIFAIIIIIVIILSSLILGSSKGEKKNSHEFAALLILKMILIDLMTFILRTSNLIVEVMVMCGIYVNLNDFNEFMVRNFILFWLYIIFWEEDGGLFIDRLTICLNF